MPGCTHHADREAGPELLPFLAQAAPKSVFPLASDSPRPPACPFVGVRPFDEEHAQLFFGRGIEISVFVDRLESAPVLALLGPSGSGKSSFVQAGVIPRLKSQQPPWLVLKLRPDSDPFAALAAELRVLGCGEITGHRQGGLARELYEDRRLLARELSRLAQRQERPVLLFVDQLEELFHLVPEVETQKRFLRALHAVGELEPTPVRLVYALRDYRARRLEDLGFILPRDQVMVLRRPAFDRLAETLRGPLQRGALRHEDLELLDAIDAIVAKLRGEAACLPLAQQIGLAIWQHGRDAFEESGGVSGALARHAEGAADGLHGRQVLLARQILLRLVGSDGRRRARPRPAVLEGLSPDAAVVLRHLTRTRLITIGRGPQGEPTVELAHGSMIRAWERLRLWLEEAWDEMALLEEVGQAAGLWEGRGRRAADLWRGPRLWESCQAARRCTLAVPRRALQFLIAGLTEERRRRRSRDRLTRALVLLGSIGAAAVILAAFA